jgi:uncharacterized protein YlxW (UPF0749 family)
VRRGAWACGVTALLGFLIVTARLNPRPGDASVRAPERTRLASLIRIEQKRSEQLRTSAVELRRQVQAFDRNRGQGGEPPAELRKARVEMGLVAVEGPGVVVELDDSSSRESPSGNLNDLVIHSEDVQAVANGLWAAGAEAVAVSGQRVVPTSALLCVGNTLLINGTVHSPPYRFLAIGTDLRSRFLADPLVQRFAMDAERFELGFSVVDRQEITVPAYMGTTTVRFARHD